MRTLELVNHLTDAQLKEHLGTASGKPEFSRWQILYMVQVAGIRSASVISPLVNLSRSSVYKIIEQYNKAGVSGIKYTLRGGRRRSLLSQSAESDLLDIIEQKAVKGLIKTANDIRVIVEAKVGKAVSDDYLWDYLSVMVGKRKCRVLTIPKEMLQSNRSLKKTPRPFGSHPLERR
jgi:transposase